jgi:hypothetical protein
MSSFLLTIYFMRALMGKYYRQLLGVRIVIFATFGSLVLGSNSKAAIGVFDWEDNVACSSSRNTDSLILTNARGTLCRSSGSGTNSLSNGTFFSNDLQGLKVVHVNGIPFTPIEIALGEYSLTLRPSSVGFVGYKADGSVVTVDAPLDGVADGPNGAQDFQVFVFPSSFENIVRLEVPSGLWSFDNFVYATIIPPPLPTEVGSNTSFSSVTTIFSKSTFSNFLIIGTDYSFPSGSSAPDSTRVVRTGDNRTISSTYSPYFSLSGAALSYVNSARDTVYGYQNGATTTLATTSDTTSTGLPILRLSFPRWLGSDLVFMGYATSDADTFVIFRKVGNTTQALVTPQTALPSPNSVGTVTPFYFPRNIAVWSGGFAFDTSLATAAGVTRLYRGDFSSNFRYIIGKNDSISLPGGSAQVTAIKSFDFAANGDLVVDVTLNSGTARLLYGASGLISTTLTTLTVAPLNVGQTVTGSLIPATSVTPAILSSADGQVYQEKEGKFYRVIGVGDRIGAETISMLELKAVPALAPARVVVEVRYTSSPSTANVLECVLAQPIAHRPRLGAPYIHPESGDWFVPLSYITAGKTRWLAKSTDLKIWSRLWQIEAVRPIQHIFIPREHTQLPKVFFRVEEE